MYEKERCGQGLGVYGLPIELSSFLYSSETKTLVVWVTKGRVITIPHKIFRLISLIFVNASGW